MQHPTNPDRLTVRPTRGYPNIVINVWTICRPHNSTGDVTKQTRMPICMCERYIDSVTPFGDHPHNLADMMLGDNRLKGVDNDEARPLPNVDGSGGSRLTTATGS